jgi:hypothetical protein
VLRALVAAPVTWASPFPYPLPRSEPRDEPAGSSGRTVAPRRVNVQTIPTHRLVVYYFRDLTQLGDARIRHLVDS